MSREVFAQATVVDSFQTEVEVNDWYEAEPKAKKELEKRYADPSIVHSEHCFERVCENGKRVYTVTFYFEITVLAQGNDEASASEALAAKIRSSTPSPIVMATSIS
jgi:hypothetical protein